ncbi:hypothetical protein EMGBD4_08940 [Verrucomicrobiota bacterium]|nr:hypothetical protein EMGBD4_08940 [Verrucomicrobiota bacterium]
MFFCFALIGGGGTAGATPPVPPPLQLAQSQRQAALQSERAAEVAAREIKAGDKSLRWLEREFNLAPEGQRSLWISMHGGGGAPAAVNDQQWRNQIRLYAQPKASWSRRARRPTPGISGMSLTSTVSSTG